MAYTPPVEEYGFLLRHVFHGDKCFAEATGGELTVEDAEAVLATAAEFAVDVLHPLNSVGDRVGARLEDGEVITAPGFAEAFKGYASGGWIGFSASRAAGGDGMPRLLVGPVAELWAAANSAFALCNMLTEGAIAALDAAADDHQRQTYLTPLVEGSWTGTMNLTEPQAGTDLAAIRTTARPAGDGTWKIKGRKIFITWGDHDVAENIVHLVLARTPDAPDGLGVCRYSSSRSSCLPTPARPASATASPRLPLSTSWAFTPARRACWSTRTRPGSCSGSSTRAWLACS